MRYLKSEARLGGKFRKYARLHLLVTGQRILVFSGRTDIEVDNRLITRQYTELWTVVSDV